MIMRGVVRCSVAKSIDKTLKRSTQVTPPPHLLTHTPKAPIRHKALCKKSNPGQHRHKSLESYNFGACSTNFHRVLRAVRKRSVSRNLSAPERRLWGGGGLQLHCLRPTVTYEGNPQDVCSNCGAVATAAMAGDCAAAAAAAAAAAEAITAATAAALVPPPRRAFGCAVTGGGGSGSRAR